WMVMFPQVLSSSGLYKSIPLGPRIPILALVLCLPAGFVLSLLTPLAIKLGLPDVAHTGRVAGMVFALSTLGCLLGNYLTRFVLIPKFTIDTLTYASSAVLGLLGLGTLMFLRDSAQSGPESGEETQASPSHPGPMNAATASTANPHAFSDIRLAY